MKVNLEKIQYAKSIIEKNIGQNQLIIKNLEPEELHDYQKIMPVSYTHLTLPTKA